MWAAMSASASRSVASAACSARSAVLGVADDALLHHVHAHHRDAEHERGDHEHQRRDEREAALGPAPAGSETMRLCFHGARFLKVTTSVTWVRSRLSVGITVPPANDAGCGLSVTPFFTVDESN